MVGGGVPPMILPLELILDNVLHVHSLTFRGQLIKK